MSDWFPFDKPPTVRELLAGLQTFDPAMRVLIQADGTDYGVNGLCADPHEKKVLMLWADEVDSDGEFVPKEDKERRG